MKSQELISLFEEHLKDFRAVPVDDNDNITTLYSSEDVKLDRRKNRIRLPMIGWVDMERKISKKLSFGWVAVYQLDGKFNLMMGSGNPFASNDLPKKNGIVVAVPWSSSQTVMDLFPPLPS